MVTTQVDCCDGLRINFSKIGIPSMAMYISWQDQNLWWTLACVCFNPLFWNTIARYEYRTRRISRLCTSPKIGVFIIAFCIFSLGLYRDFQFKLTLDSQPRWPILHNNYILWGGYLLIWIGTVLVISSFLALGFYGTFLGDYFGILMDHRVTGFPFSICDNPMYVGSTLNFLGSAFVRASQTGVFISVFVWVVYWIALQFEGPFTAKIYAERTENSDKTA